MDSRVEIAWEEGISIFEAWWFFATEREQDAFRSARDQGAIKARQLTMQANLIARLRGGDLVAIGIRVQPDSDATPQQIPAHLFNSNNELVRRLFSRSDDHVSLSGRRWSGVTVHDPKMMLTQSEVLLLPPPIIESPMIAVKRKRIGRPDIDQELQQVVRALRDEGRLDGLLRKEQEHLVRDKARSDFPRRFPKKTQPSRPKILAALIAVLEGTEST